MQRVLRINEVVQDIGTVLDDATSEIVWGGARLREILLDNCDWESVSWISSEGVTYQRYYNVWNETWRFSDAKTPGVGENGDLLVNVGSGGGAQRIRLCRAIALAWLEYPKVTPGEKRVAMQLRDDQHLHCDNIGWVRRNFKSSENNNDPETITSIPLTPQGRQTWYPVTVYRYWKSGQYERFECPEKLSPSGWVARVDGSMTRGVRSHNARLRVCLSSHGAIWVEDLLYGSLFGSLPVGNKVMGLCHEDVSANKLSIVACHLALNDTSHQIYSQFCDGDTIEHLSFIHNVPKGVIWTRICNTVESLPECELPASFWGNVIYDEGVRDVSGDWIDAQNPILGCPLKKMRDAILATTGGVNLDDDDLYGMLKLVKQLAKSRRFSAHACGNGMY
tara:strand:+ start:1712 stop:2887 length:1176 start_codon:yes stop_codon:yes gene_type:complete